MWALASQELQRKMAQPSGSRSQLLAEVRPKEKVVALSKHGKWEKGGTEGDKQREGETVSREKRENDTGRGPLVRLTSWLVRVPGLFDWR